MEVLPQAVDNVVYVIVAVPALKPKTVPPSTLATLVLLLLHVPPTSPVLLKLTDEPVQTADGPLMIPAFGAGLTFTVYVV